MAYSGTALKWKMWRRVKHRHKAQMPDGSGAVICRRCGIVGGYLEIVVLGMDEQPEDIARRIASDIVRQMFGEEERER